MTFHLRKLNACKIVKEEKQLIKLIDKDLRGNWIIKLDNDSLTEILARIGETDVGKELTQKVNDFTYALESNPIYKLIHGR